MKEYQVVGRIVRVHKRGRAVVKYIRESMAIKHHRAGDNRVIQCVALEADGVTEKPQEYEAFHIYEMGEQWSFI